MALHTYGPNGQREDEAGDSVQVTTLVQRVSLGDGGPLTVWLLCWSDRSVTWSRSDLPIPEVGAIKAA